MPSELGKLIRAERTKREIGLRQFATRVGKSPAFMVRLETDAEVPSVSEETLVTVAAALKLDANLVLALARKVPKELAPESQLDIAVLRKVKAMSAADKEHFLRSGRDKQGGS